MKLQFSQQNSQPTPSAQLGQGFKAMSLSSQQSAGGSASGTQSDKPPVPLFADGGPPVSSQQLPLGPQLDMPCLSQQDMLGTQDFITPVDQFGSQYDPKDAKRSPARLTPNRVKRPRQSSATGEFCWAAELVGLRAVLLHLYRTDDRRTGGGRTAEAQPLGASSLCSPCHARPCCCAHLLAACCVSTGTSIHIADSQLWLLST